MNTLAIHNLNLCYDDKVIINNFSFTFNQGITCLIGPSGCGKTSLFNCIINKDSSINYQGDISYLSQESILLPWLNVYDNINLINKLKETNIDIDSYLEKYKLIAYKKMFPHELSGGTKRRINLLMTFLNPSNIILLDEPFNQIDMINKEYFYDFVKTLNQEFNKIILINTHDINEAINLSNTIITLTSKPMSIKKVYQHNFNYDDILSDLR